MFGLFKDKNFTKDWQRLSGVELHADLGEGSLCGIRLGGQVEHLAFLGPVEDVKALKIGDLCYKSLGLNIGIETPSRIIDSFVLHLSDPLNEGFAPFPGRLSNRGKPLKTDRSGVAGELGEPYWKDRDDDEELWFYETGGFELQLEFDLSGILRVVIITAKPLMADEAQRNAYGVTKPWPPGW